MTKKTMLCGLLLAQCLLNSGCLFMNSASSRPEIYDLPVQTAAASVHPLRIGSIRNLSGADRRVQLREKDCRIRQVEDYLWLLSPTAMIERKLKETFSAPILPERTPTLHTTLRHFEFDAESREAFVGINYELHLPDQSRICISKDYREKVLDDNYTAAMDAALQKSISDLEAALTKISEKNR